MSVAVTLLSTLALAALPASASAVATPDPAFGDGGFVTTPIAGAQAVGYDATVLGNGKIVVAGQATTATNNGQIVVARYLTDGSLDDSFGDGGIYTSELPPADGPFLARAVRQARDSRKILVAGGYGQGSMLALRLTAKGKPDPTFGKSGFTTLPVGGVAGALAIQSDGRILLGGADGNDNGQPMVIARLNADGSTDASYGDDGIVKSIFWDPMMAASAGVSGLRIARGSGGGLVGFGHIDYIGGDGHGSAGVFRLDSDGEPVTSFGSGGHTEIDFPTGQSRPAFWFPCAMSQDSQGRITVTGDSTNFGGAMLSTRLTAAGAPDSSFGNSGDGRVITPGWANNDNFTTCGAALTGGKTLTAAAGPIAMQLTSAGSTRPSFGPGGLLRITDPTGVGINAVRRSAFRRVIFAGSAGADLYLAQYRIPPPG